MHKFKFSLFGVLLAVLPLSLYAQSPDSSSSPYSPQTFMQSSSSQGFLMNSTVMTPKSLSDYESEYTSTGGGPMSQWLGIQPAYLTGNLMTAFFAFLLTIFTGGAVLSGLHRAAVGGGDLNLIHIGLKYMLGVVVVFNIPFVYALGKEVQASAWTAIYYAMQTNAGQSALGTVQAASPAAMSIGQAEYDAVRDARSQVTPYLVNNPASVLPSINNELSSDSMPPINFDPSSNSSLTTATREAVRLTPEAILRDNSYSSQASTIKANYLQGQMTEDNLVQAQRQLLEAAATTAYTMYGISPGSSSSSSSSSGGGLSSVINWVSNAVSPWWDEITGFLTRFIANLLIPFFLWIVVCVSSLILELSLVILVVTYPFWMLEATKRAFLGAVNTYMSAAVMPAMAYILMSIFELIMAQAFKFIIAPTAAVGLFTGGTLSIILLIGYCVTYIIGCIIVCWKTPSITKAILEGGSVIGQMAGAMLTTAIGGAAAAAGVGLVIASAGAAAPALGGAAAAAGGASGAGATGAAAGSTAAPGATVGAVPNGTGLPGGSLPNADSVNTGADRMKNNLADKQAKQDEKKMGGKLEGLERTNFIPEGAGGGPATPLLSTGGSKGGAKAAASAPSTKSAASTALSAEGGGGEGDASAPGNELATSSGPTSAPAVAPRIMSNSTKGMGIGPKGMAQRLGATAKNFASLVPTSRPHAKALGSMGAQMAKSIAMTVGTAVMSGGDAGRMAEILAARRLDLDLVRLRSDQTGRGGARSIT